MKRLACILFCLTAILSSTPLYGQQSSIIYDEWFTPDRLRIDLILTGNAQHEEIALRSLVHECGWSGPKNTLIDPFRYGEYFYELRSGETVLFSRGFCTLFQEWLSTEEAKTVTRAFTNCIWTPFPKKTCELVISHRNWNTGVFEETFHYTIDPSKKSISYEKENSWEVVKVQDSGEVGNKVDLLFIAEGYTEKEMPKFIADVNRMTEAMFLLEPYRSHRGDFNVWAVKSVSEESGTDIPNQDIWRSTAVNSSFYTFEEDRYLTAPDHLSVARAASGAPFDALFVLVNSQKYGGGGIYNFYSLTTVDNRWTEEVLIHEFGHSFAGLGDEYYTPGAMDEMYNKNIEPWEPNITTLVDFESKWKDLLPPGVQIPTPAVEANKSVVGVFEGAGYQSKGIYRPVMDCRMRVNQCEGFCPVCRRVIERMIDFWCGRDVTK